jgi:hypothetical protein
MSDGLQVERSSACLSDLAFDRLRAGELGAVELATSNEHLLDCKRCQMRIARIEKGAADFLGAHPQFQVPVVQVPVVQVPVVQVPVVQVPGVQAGAHGKVNRRARITAAAGVFAMAAALFLYVRHGPVGESSPGGAGTRLKGGDRIGFFVKRGSNVFPGSNNDMVAAGDILRFTVTSASPRYLAIVSVDAAHHASIYYPSGERAELHEAGRDVALPSSVELDGALGTEQIYGLFCKEPFLLEPFRKALEKATISALLPKDCELDTIAIVKRAMP